MRRRKGGGKRIRKKRLCPSFFARFVVGSPRVAPAVAAAAVAQFVLVIVVVVVAVVVVAAAAAAAAAAVDCRCAGGELPGGED